MGSELSALNPGQPPMWEWESTRPGMIVLPVTSTWVALIGIETSVVDPIAVIRPSSTTRIPSGIGSPVMGINFAPT